MNTRHTRVLTVTWASGKPVKVRDIVKALRDRNVEVIIAS